MSLETSLPGRAGQHRVDCCRQLARAERKISVSQSKSAGSTAMLEWFGTSTFRVKTNGLTLFFDAYLDRIPGLDPVGLSTAEVDQADFIFVSHAHFDHLYGVDTVALRTGATVVCSPRALGTCGRAGSATTSCSW